MSDGAPDDTVGEYFSHRPRRVFETTGRATGWGSRATRRRATASGAALSGGCSALLQVRRRARRALRQRVDRLRPHRRQRRRCRARPARCARRPVRRRDRRRGRRRAQGPALRRRPARGRGAVADDRPRSAEASAARCDAPDLGVDGDGANAWLARARALDSSARPRRSRRSAARARARTTRSCSTRTRARARPAAAAGPTARPPPAPVRGVPRVRDRRAHAAQRDARGRRRGRRVGRARGSRGPSAPTARRRARTSSSSPTRPRAPLPAAGPGSAATRPATARRSLRRVRGREPHARRRGPGVVRPGALPVRRAQDRQAARRRRQVRRRGVGARPRCATAEQPWRYYGPPAASAFFAARPNASALAWRRRSSARGRGVYFDVVGVGACAARAVPSRGVAGVPEDPYASGSAPGAGGEVAALAGLGDDTADRLAWVERGARPATARRREPRALRRRRVPAAADAPRSATSSRSCRDDGTRSRSRARRRRTSRRASARRRPRAACRARARARAQRDARRRRGRRPRVHVQARRRPRSSCAKFGCEAWQLFRFELQLGALDGQGGAGRRASSAPKRWTFSGAFVGGGDLGVVRGRRRRRRRPRTRVLRARPRPRSSAASGGSRRPTRSRPSGARPSSRSRRPPRAARAARWLGSAASSRGGGALASTRVFELHVEVDSSPHARGRGRAKCLRSPARACARARRLGSSGRVPPRRGGAGLGRRADDAASPRRPRLRRARREAREARGQPRAARPRRRGRGRVRGRGGGRAYAVLALSEPPVLYPAFAARDVRVGDRGRRAADADAADGAAADGGLGAASVFVSRVTKTLLFEGVGEGRRPRGARGRARAKRRQRSSSARCAELADEWDELGASVNGDGEAGWRRRRHRARGELGLSRAPSEDDPLLAPLELMLCYRLRGRRGRSGVHRQAARRDAHADSSRARARR